MDLEGVSGFLGTVIAVVVIALAGYGIWKRRQNSRSLHDNNSNPGPGPCSGLHAPANPQPSTSSQGHPDSQVDGGGGASGDLLPSSQQQNSCQCEPLIDVNAVVGASCGAANAHSSTLYQSLDGQETPQPSTTRLEFVTPRTSMPRNVTFQAPLVPLPDLPSAPTSQTRAKEPHTPPKILTIKLPLDNVCETARKGLDFFSRFAQARTETERNHFRLDMSPAFRRRLETDSVFASTFDILNDPEERRILRAAIPNFSSSIGSSFYSDPPETASSTQGRTTFSATSASDTHDSQKSTIPFDSQVEGVTVLPPPPPTASESEDSGEIAFNFNARVARALLNNRAQQASSSSSASFGSSPIGMSTFSNDSPLTSTRVSEQTSSSAGLHESTFTITP